MKGNNKTLMTVAGCLFLVSAVSEIIQIFMNHYTLSSVVLALIIVIGYIMIGIGLFTNKPTLAGAGGCILIVRAIIFTFYMIHMYSEAMEPIPSKFILLRIVYLIEWLLFTIAMFMKKKVSFYLCILSVIIVFIARLTQHISIGNVISFIFNTLLLWVGIVVAGKAVSDLGPIIANASANTTTKAAPHGDTAERLSKLKSLLDQGIITQEEFDTKKKEILG